MLPSFFSSGVDWGAPNRDEPEELPAAGCITTFFYPREVTNLSLVADSNAIGTLPGVLQEVSPSRVIPIRVGGDGNCLVRAVSFAIWGVEDYHKALRNSLIWELIDNKEWYMQACKDPTLEEKEWEKEWEELRACAQQEGSYLGNAHFFALANVTKRVIVLYASDERVNALGVGEGGVSATFIPSRIPYEEWRDLPIIPIVWSSKNMNHFVPLVGIEDALITWPSIPVAYRQDERVEGFNLEHILANSLRDAPLRVNQLRNGANIDHMKSDTLTSSQYKPMAANQIVVLNGKLYIVRTPAPLEPKEPLYGQVFLEGKFVPINCDYVEMDETIDMFLSIHGLPNISPYREPLENYITVMNTTQEQRSLAYLKATGGVETLLPLPRPDNHFETFPIGRWKFYSGVKKEIDPMFNTIKVKCGKLLSDQELACLEGMDTYITNFEVHKEGGFKAKVPVSEWCALLIKLIRVNTDIVFAAVDLARLLVRIPQVSDYFAEHSLTVSDPHNIMAAVLPHFSNLHPDGNLFRQIQD